MTPKAIDETFTSFPRIETPRLTLREIRVERRAGALCDVF